MTSSVLPRNRYDVINWARACDLNITECNTKEHEKSVTILDKF